MPVTKKKPAARKVAAKPRKKASPKRTFARPFVDDFLEAYVTAALWSSTDDDEMPMDRRFGIDDIDAETLATMGKDCQDFQRKHGHLFEGNESHAGHDFWLTRNGHGVGFWARPEVYGQRQADTLSEAARMAGSFDLYVGDDGRVHGTPLSRRNGYALRHGSARRPAAKKSRASRSNGVRSPSYPFLVVERMTGRVQAGAETRNDAEDMRHDLPTPAADLQVLTRDGVRRKFGRISWASVATMRNPQRPARANGATFVKVVGDRTRGSTVRGARHNYRTVEVLVYQSPNSMATARTYEIVTDASYNTGDGAYTTDVWKLPEPVAVQQAIYTAVRNLRGGGRNRRAPVPAE